LEIGCLSVIDVQAPDKEVLQGPGQNLVSHYMSIIQKRMDVLKQTVRYLVADSYFRKHGFIAP
jgi:hypothetical protein